MCTVKAQKHRFPLFIIISPIVCQMINVFTVAVNVKKSPQNTDDQHYFSMPCLFVLISHNFKPFHRN